MNWRLSLVLAASAVFCLPSVEAAGLQWFTLTYADLQGLQLARPEFKDMWRDRLLANNQFYLAAGDRRFAFGTAPATEAHFFVEARPQARLLMASILNAAEACRLLQQDPASGAKLKSCPLRLLLQDHGATLLKDAAQACFVEYASAGTLSAAQQRANAMFARYDLASNTLRLDARFGGRLQDQCAVAVPLPAWPSRPK